eukprot:m.89979 g.89979  ORF g.89979 m.89979 type:complete len:430 (+) comp15244_c0_seq5:828-2117(+)
MAERPILRHRLQRMYLERAAAGVSCSLQPGVAQTWWQVSVHSCLRRRWAEEVLLFESPLPLSSSSFALSSSLVSCESGASLRLVCGACAVAGVFSDLKGRCMAASAISWTSTASESTPARGLSRNRLQRFLPWQDLHHSSKRERPKTLRHLSGRMATMRKYSLVRWSGPPRREAPEGCERVEDATLSSSSMSSMSSSSSELPYSMSRFSAKRRWRLEEGGRGWSGPTLSSPSESECLSAATAAAAAAAAAAAGRGEGCNCWEVRAGRRARLPAEPSSSWSQLGLWLFPNERRRLLPLLPLPLPPRASPPPLPMDSMASIMWAEGVRTRPDMRGTTAGGSGRAVARSPAAECWSAAMSGADDGTVWWSGTVWDGAVQEGEGSDAEDAAWNRSPTGSFNPCSLKPAASSLTMSPAAAAPTLLVASVSVCVG